jgi:UrcA family protein
MRSKISMLLLSVLAVCAGSVTMAADSRVMVKSELVRYEDIRLISAVGAAVLYGRLRAAADRTCGGPVDNLSLAQKQRYKACMDEAMANAVADVNHPVLTRFYESKRNASSAPSSTPAPSSTVANAR